MQPLPVIVGTGLTGCAISRALSRAGIDHLLVGPPPDPEGPRLGESLNLEGSLDILDYFPELQAAYTAKSAVTSHLGDIEVRCDLNMQRSRTSAAFYAAIGYKRPPEAFLHVDRRGFDAAAFASVLASPHCRHVDGRVEAVDHDPASDRVTRIVLDGGRELRSSTIFDATNHVRAIARHLGLELTTLGPAQRAVYGHYTFDGEVTDDERLWLTTHVVRLEPARDGVDGLAWYIPLRDGIASFGVGVDLGHGGDDRTLLDLAYAAIERRAIVPAGRFRGPDKVRTLPRYDHFMYARAFGGNWLLAGGTFCTTWFPAASGISSGFAAANVAPDFVRDPAAHGPAYETILRTLERPHGVFEWIRRVDPSTTSCGEVERRADTLVEQSVIRLLMTVQLRPQRVRGAVSGAIERLIRRHGFDPSGICLRVNRPADAAARLATLAQVLEVFAGQRPLAAIDGLIHRDVVVHIDRLRFTGLGGWKKWARHSHATWPFEQLRFEVVDHTYDPAADRLEVGIAAVAVENGVERRSAAERFVYRFEGDMVREIWTSRRNYSFLYGAKFARLPGFAAHVARLMWWNRRHPEAGASLSG